MNFIRPERFSPEEWEARVQLAAAYRIFDHLGWTELIYNHISLRVPGRAAHFLINPFGLHYTEVTRLEPGEDRPRRATSSATPTGRSTRPGITFHGAIHATLPDAHCVMHMHTTATHGGLLPRRRACRSPTSTPRSSTARSRTTTSKASPSTPTKASASCAAPSGKPVLLLRNHGPVTIGADPAAGASLMWTVQPRLRGPAGDAGHGRG